MGFEEKTIQVRIREKGKEKPLQVIRPKSDGTFAAAVPKGKKYQVTYWFNDSTICKTSLTIKKGPEHQHIERSVTLNIGGPGKGSTESEESRLSEEKRRKKRERNQEVTREEGRTQVRIRSHIRRSEKEKQTRSLKAIRKEQERTEKDRIYRNKCEKSKKKKRFLKDTANARKEMKRAKKSEED